MSVPLYNQKTLWEMSIDEFNLWRINNDLPILFTLFCDKLPKFQEWLSYFNLDKRCFLMAPHTGEWFLGNNELIYVEYSDNGELKGHIAPSFDKLNQLGKIKIVSRKMFIPYLVWAKNEIGLSQFILINKQNKWYSDTIKYTGWQSDINGTNSRANLFYHFSVLKLGETKLFNYSFFDKRNLDFVDLDSLHITEEWHGTYAVKIIFSSCRNLTLESGKLHHFSFNQCNVEDLTIIDSRIDNFYFENCNITSPYFRGSYINGLFYNNCELLNPIIERSEVERFEYIPPKIFNPKREIDNCRRFRTSFQNMGKIDEARNYYYKERCYDRKLLNNPHLVEPEMFPTDKYCKNISMLYSKRLNSQLKDKTATTFLKDIFLLHIKYLRYNLNYFISLFLYLLWGYGERPLRILFNALSIIALYSICYYKIGPENTKYSLINSIYFSVVTFTTLGYGDIRPDTNFLKILCSSEAFIGAFLIGLFIAGFSKRASY